MAESQFSSFLFLMEFLGFFLLRFQFFGAYLFFLVRDAIHGSSWEEGMIWLVWRIFPFTIHTTAGRHFCAPFNWGLKSKRAFLSVDRRERLIAVDAVNLSSFFFCSAWV